MGKVYLEPVFAVNALMNLLTLYVAGRLCGRRGCLWRYLSASALGGVYAALQLLPFARALNHLAAKAALSLLMAAVAWRPVRWLAYLKGWASMVGVTAVGGGGALAASALLEAASARTGTVHLGANALLLTALGAASILLFSAQALRRRGGAPARYAVRVYRGGRPVRLEALLDTGNLLREPLSGLPVLLVDRSLAPSLIGSGDAVEIPFGTAGGTATVRAVPAERVEVLRGGRWTCPGDMYLAACGARLANGVEALLPPSALD